MSRFLVGDRREAGFALMETLVASAVIAAMMGLTYEAIETSAKATRELQDRRQAVLVAQSALASVGTDIALSPGTVSGSSAGFGWRIDIEPYRGGEAGAHAGGPELFDVHVSANAPGRDRPLVSLRSLRVGG